MSDFADIFVSLHNAFDACDGKLAGRTTFGHGAMCVEAVKREKKKIVLWMLIAMEVSLITVRDDARARRHLT